MIARICFIITALWTVGVCVTAFAPTLTTTHNTIGMTQSNFKFQQAHVVPSCNRINKITIRNLSSTEPESESTSDAATTTTKQSADGTFYDDEVEPTVAKVGISETMKERLRREASTGLDADKPQDNVILYIIAAVSVLVLLGGKDIFY